MSDFIQQTISGFEAMSAWEYIAVGLSLIYMLLAMKQSLWCWPAAFFSTLIYTLLFFNGALLMESLLNVFYMVMALYGWHSWRQNAANPGSTAGDNHLPVESWSATLHHRSIVITLTVAVGLGYIMDNYTHADYAYLDTLTTCFSIVATYLLAKKVLENWLYWVVIDAVSIYLYVSKGYYPTAVLFVFYTVMALINYFQWRQTLPDKNLRPAVS